MRFRRYALQEEVASDDTELRALVGEGVEQVRRGEVSPLEMDSIIAKVERLRAQDREGR